MAKRDLGDVAVTALDAPRCSRRRLNFSEKVGYS
jgi:hypothetical protein